MKSNLLSLSSVINESLAVKPFKSRRMFYVTKCIYCPRDFLVELYTECIVLDISAAGNVVPLLHSLISNNRLYL